jgi:hypothetical protein
MTQVSTQPRTPQQHYAESERLLAAAPETPESAPLLAVAHAILTLAPRRARRIRSDTGSMPPTGGSPQQRWLYGDTEGDDR